jgi:SagB-type dehydrogenase family enzyme
MRLQSLIAPVLGPVLGIVMSGALLQPTLSYGSDTVQLPAPQMHGGMPLMEALSQRRSIRSFAETDLDEATLSALLWAAFGINRPESGDRTAPSWRGSKETDIHVARADGVWLYDPGSHSLHQVLEGDIRAETGRQPFVEAAPVVLIYVADRSRMAEAPEEDHRLYAHVDTALIAQNVYLFAASQGLATVILGNVDKPALAAALGLGDDQILTFTQPVGHRE